MKHFSLGLRVSRFIYGRRWNGESSIAFLELLIGLALALGPGKGARTEIESSHSGLGSSPVNSGVSLSKRDSK